ncbi:uncharacterized protein DS421_16g537960 [Arachis hypogaea]|nr:uncharacterized protein DS421_16g537960 [Arachis hypogaea]
MTTGRGVVDQPSGRGRGRESDSAASIRSIAHCLGNATFSDRHPAPESSHGSQPYNAHPPPSIVNFIWDKEHDAFIRKIYDYQMGRQLQHILKVERGHFLASPRNQEGSSKSFDRNAILAETFKYTHTLKENKERFSNQLSVDHYESDTQRLEATTQQTQQSGKDTSGSVASVVNPDAIWRKRDRLRAVQELTRNLYEQARELNETRERYQEILTHVMGTNELILEWREKLERLQRMEQQMAVYEAQMHASGSRTTEMTTMTIRIFIDQGFVLLFHCI